jgi:hypothetical protein
MKRLRSLPRELIRCCSGLPSQRQLGPNKKLRGRDERDGNLAVARGEALAAQLIASAALQAMLMVLPNRLEVLRGISAFIDDTLNMSGPGQGDAHDELNTQMREVARFQATQTLQQIEHSLRNSPARG